MRGWRVELERRRNPKIWASHQNKLLDPKKRRAMRQWLRQVEETVEAYVAYNYWR